MRITLLMALIPAMALGEVPQGPANADYAPAFVGQTRVAALPGTPVQVTQFAGGLRQPWGIARLPSGQFLVTQKGGQMRLLGPDGANLGLIGGVTQSIEQGQGGLLDVAVSPRFAQDRLVFWTYAKPLGTGAVTAAGRGVLGADGQLGDVRDIFVQDSPSAGARHFGSRIIAMADGTVWITTGDRGVRASAQDRGSTRGKVIRINWDGSIPEGQGGAIWSLGHRNIQGAAIAPDGALWSVEHGPRGGDELNQPRAGRNYGWPLISYGLNYDGSAMAGAATARDGMEQPVYYWDPVIAPGGMAFYNGNYAGWRGDLLIASLNPGGLVRLKLRGGRVVGEERLLTDVGRIRDVEVLPDGAVLVLLDQGRILRVVPG